MTKTNTKKMFVAIMVATMLASMSTGAFAKSPSDSETQARGAICTECGSGEMVLRREYGPWENVGFDACIHGDPTKKDTIQERKIWDKYVCTNTKCATVQKGEERTETRRVHR